jgi:integrase/recombinase XerD
MLEKPQLIEQAIARFLTYLKYEQGGAKNTVVAYRTDLLQFRQVLNKELGGGLKGNSLEPSQLDPYLRWLENQGYKPSTRARKLAALRSFISYLQAEEELQLNGHIDKLALPKDQRQMPHGLSRAQIQDLISAPAQGTSARDIRDAAILAFLYATGLKAAAAVGVTVDDIDFVRGLLDSPMSDTGPIPLGIAHHPVERYVKDGRPQLLRNRGENTLFLNQRGDGLTRQGLWLVVKRWAKTCNLPADVSPYTLRHSLTQHLLSSGKTRKEVQKRLGLTSANAIRYHISAQSRS